MSGKIKFLGLVTLLGLLGALLLFGISGWAQKAKPPNPPPADPAIAYVAEKGWGHTNLMVMNADGSNQKVLLDGVTGAGYGNHYPNWSPDGNWIVFGRTSGGMGYENWISIIKKDGTGLCNVVPTVMVPCWGDGVPKWLPVMPLPNMPMISYYDSGSLFFVDAICGANSPINLSEPLQPTWAPHDLRFAAFSLHSPDEWDLFIFELKLDLNQNWTVVPINNLTDAGPLADASLTEPDWAKNSDKIAVAACLPNDPDIYDIWVIDLNDSANPVNLTRTTDISEKGPSWSPLDTQIVYVRNNSIYVMNADGLNVKRLASSPRKDLILRDPDWRRNLY